MNKRPSIASLAPKKSNFTLNVQKSSEGTPAEDAGSRTPAAPDSRQGSNKTPPPYKSILSKVDTATHKQLKRLAVDEGVPVGDLQIEALNLLFRSRGLPEIAVRVTPDEREKRRTGKRG